MIKNILTILSIGILLSSCIKDDFLDDFVDPELRINQKVSLIALDSSFNFKARYFNYVGAEETINPLWTSSNSSVIEINENSGMALAISEGESIIKVTYFNGSIFLADSVLVEVIDSVIISEPKQKSGTVQTTSSYPLSGSYNLTENGSGLTLELLSNYFADNSLPGLYIYLSNNNTTTANALEIGPVTVFQGAHSYQIDNVGINDYKYILYYCKPFNVKVGDGLIPVE